MLQATVGSSAHSGPPQPPPPQMPAYQQPPPLHSTPPVLPPQLSVPPPGPSMYQQPPPQHMPPQHTYYRPPPPPQPAPPVQAPPGSVPDLNIDPAQRVSVCDLRPSLIAYIPGLNAVRAFFLSTANVDSGVEPDTGSDQWTASYGTGCHSSLGTSPSAWLILFPDAPPVIAEPVHGRHYCMKKKNRLGRVRASQASDVYFCVLFF